tara:strand:+ start:8412 stop:9389 length:978 start_codon:yes stop_codon:yes gene_type:complete
MRDAKHLNSHIGRTGANLPRAIIRDHLASWYTWKDLSRAILDDPTQPELRRVIDAAWDSGDDVLAVKRGLRSLMLEDAKSRSAYKPDYLDVKQGGRRFLLAVEWLQQTMDLKRTGKVGQVELNLVWAFMTNAERKLYETGTINPTKKRKPVKRDPRLDAVKLMQTWIGKVESPPFSNVFPPLQGAVARLLNKGVKIPKWQVPGGFAWCVWACFVALADSGSKSAVAEIEKSNAAYTMTVLADARAKRNGLSIVTTPRRGDIALFDLPRGDKVDHAGLVLSVTAKTVTCVEGNTSSGSLGSQDAGGGCYQRTRDRRIVRAFVRVKV